MKKILSLFTIIGVLIFPAQIYSQHCGTDGFTSDFSRPFVIDGEGAIPNYIGLEPLPDGRLLAQTPLSYKFLDPDTGKFSDLPQGFPEGEITQWEEDFAVVRTRTGSDPFYHFVFTIWPGNKKFLSRTDNVCFLDKEGSFATITFDETKRDHLLAVFDLKSNLLWKSELFLYSSTNSPIRFFEDKIAFFESSDHSTEIKIAFYNKSDGQLIFSGSAYGKNSRFLKPKQVGKKFFFANSQVFLSIIKYQDRGARACAWENYYEVADYNPKTRLFSYKKINANDEKIYECEFSPNAPIPYGYNNHYLLCVANGVIFFKFNRDGDCCLVDVENKFKPLTIPKYFDYLAFQFITKNLIIFKTMDVLNVFSLEKKEIIKKIPWSDKPIIYGSGVVTWPIATEGNGIIYKAMSTQEPEKSVQVREGFMLENHRDGIIAYKMQALKGETNAYLYGFDGSITALGRATKETRMGWCGYWKGNVYAMATLTWFPERQSINYLLRSHNGEWKIVIELPSTLMSGYSTFFRNGHILMYDSRKAIVIDLDKMSIVHIKPPDEKSGADIRARLMSDCVVLTYRIKNNTELMVYSIEDGVTTFYDNFIWASYDKICLQDKGDFYILSKGILTKIPEIKNPNYYQTERTMGEYYIISDFRITYGDDQNRNFFTSIFDTESNLLQRIPVYTTRTLSMPKELYPTYSSTGYTAPPANGFLPKSKKCAVYKIERTGEFTFDLMADYDDFSGTLWFVKYYEENPITTLVNPVSINLKNGEKMQLDFSKDWDKDADFQGFVISGDGFFETDSIGIYDRKNLKSIMKELPNFAGMQTGPSGKEVLCSIVWDNKKK